VKKKSWIIFKSLPPSGKTEWWSVLTLAGVDIGTVKWHAAWRQYTFWPLAYTVFERQCLRDIAEFCEAETAKRRTLPKLTAEQKVGA